MHTARIPPADPAPATITAVLATHAGHMDPSSELINYSRMWRGRTLGPSCIGIETSLLTMGLPLTTAIGSRLLWGNLCDGNTQSDVQFTDSAKRDLSAYLLRFQGKLAGLPEVHLRIGKFGAAIATAIL